MASLKAIETSRLCQLEHVGELVGVYLISAVSGQGHYLEHSRSSIGVVGQGSDIIELSNPKRR
ncbi:hypothetical protein [Pseudomonas shirazensis]|uniref:hypothetical protein n=1 Tax=Pseudomonas shirazensis TaxID=2745494 RepID=UPI001648F7A5|nr:hypothetical protein [Pseudomonas shirazensis]